MRICIGRTAILCSVARVACVRYALLVAVRCGSVYKYELGGESSVFRADLCLLRFSSRYRTVLGDGTWISVADSVYSYV
jgi:hypothetical protein